MTERPAVIVVGAGIAGLVLARDLAIADRRVILLESAARPGGQVAAAGLGGMDLGADAARSGAALSRLTAELGLELVSPLDAPCRVVLAPGEPRPLPAAHLSGIPAAPLAREVIDLIGLRAALRAQLDALTPMVRAGKYRTLGELVRRRMGARVLERLVAPVVRGRSGLHPDDVEPAAASPRLPGALAYGGTLAAAVAAILQDRPAGGELLGIRGGMHVLAETLAARAVRVGVDLRLGTRVEAVEASGVVLADGTRLDGRVVLAAPPPDATAGAQSTHDAHPAPDAHPTPGPREETVVVAEVESAGLDARPIGGGAVVAAGATGIAARALTHSSARWPWLGEGLGPHRHLVRLVYDTAPHDPGAVEADLRAITGVPAARVVELEARTWRRAVASAPPRGVLAVGEAAGHEGITAAVEHARRIGADLIADDDGSPE